MPPNYREQQGRPLESHERKGLVVLAAAVVVIGAGLGTWTVVGGGGAHPKGKCVSVMVGSSTGGGQLQQCGAAARSWCAEEATVAGPLASEVRAACRRQGFLPEHQGRRGPAAAAP